MITLILCLYSLFSLNPSSNRRHLSCNDCLYFKNEDYQNCSVLCCVLQLLTPNNLGGTWRRICSPDIRNVSALEVLRNCALQIDIYLLTYLHSHKHTYVSSSYKWTRTCWFRFSVCFCMLFFTMVCLSKFWFRFLCVLFCMLFFTMVCLSKFWFRFLCVLFLHVILHEGMFVEVLI